MRWFIRIVDAVSVAINLAMFVTDTSILNLIVAAFLTGLHVMNEINWKKRDLLEKELNG